MARAVAVEPGPPPGPYAVVTRRSAAVVNWVEVIRPEDVLDVKGDVPVQVMREVEQQLASWAEAQSPRS